MIARFTIAALALCAAIDPAAACDCIRYIPGAPNADRDIKAIVDHAAVILDGIVVKPLGPRLEPAVVRPLRILKGPKAVSYKVGVISDCALMLRAPDVRTGRRIRLVLYGTPELYEASRCANLQSRAFDAAVARACAAGN